jgi:hypothetical protein
MSSYEPSVSVLSSNANLRENLQNIWGIELHGNKFDGTGSMASSRTT